MWGTSCLPGWLLEWDCGDYPISKNSLHSHPKHTWNTLLVEGNRSGKEAGSEIGWGSPEFWGGALFRSHYLRYQLKDDFLVSTLWNNGVVDSSFVYMFPACLGPHHGYSYGPVCSGHRGLFCFSSWREPTGPKFSKLVCVQPSSNV